MNNKVTLIQGDCLVEMKKLPNNSVDLVVCDLPYETLNKGNKSSKWDKALPMNELWKEYKRVVKDNGAIILFAQGMFTARIMMSNEKMWRYNLIWKKGSRSTGFLNAKKMPLRNHEDICVFYKKLPTYNPQFTKGKPIHSRKTHHKDGNFKNRCYGGFHMTEPIITDEKYPISVLNFDKEWRDWYHPTQKPVELLKWLINTYSNEGEVVLDNTAGSMSTAIAALETNRKCICMEMDEHFFNVGKERVLKYMEDNNMSDSNDVVYDVPNDMLCEYKEVAENGKFCLLELSDRYVQGDGLSYEIINRYFPEFEINLGKSYFMSADSKIYTDDSEL